METTTFDYHPDSPFAELIGKAKKGDLGKEKIEEILDEYIDEYDTYGVPLVPGDIIELCNVAKITDITEINKKLDKIKKLDKAKIDKYSAE